ncbi:MAG: quinone-dependent dihydroorotate dehydrogenase [Acidobacteriota bacterium]|nr:quinone-dependent dihydroorotate dehydrogenase [Acidobacteriota bacterium]
MPAAAYSLVRPLLFALEAERAHDWVCRTLEVAQRSALLRRAWAQRWRIADPRLTQDLLGSRFDNPVVMAAGFDKDARLIPALAAFGFGAVEVGTVTPRPQPGNPRPRMWRHAAARSLQNSLGFNGAGMARVAARIEALAARPVPLGVNLGKNRDTPSEDAARDYERLLHRFAGLADYFVINVSSPNTPGLRGLQTPEFLGRVLASAAAGGAAPTLVKIDPDLEPAVAVELGAAAVEAGAAGIIATNTTTDYSLLPGARPVGGLSGAVLRERSVALLRHLGAALAGRTVLVSAGGVDSAAEAYRRLRAGASLVQLYTAFVYEGPSLAGRINAGLLKLLERDGLSHVSAAIGADL